MPLLKEITITSLGRKANKNSLSTMRMGNKTHVETMRLHARIMSR